MADGGTARDATGAPLRPPEAFTPELMLWLSPSFPVGGFAYSHGLERLVECGTITHAADLQDWIADLATLGSLRNDLILLAVAWTHARNGDWAALDETASLGAALHPSAERRLESLNQGTAFAETIARVSPGPATARLLERHAPRIPYPVALAAASAGCAIPLSPACEAYALAFASALVSAAIRLSVIGQFDAQTILNRLLPTLAAAARSATSSTLDDLGGAMFLTDIASMEHETQYTRLFRS